MKVVVVGWDDWRTVVELVSQAVLVNPPEGLEIPPAAQVVRGMPDEVRQQLRRLLLDWVLCQRDERWRSAPMGGKNCKHTIGSAGCYLTCLAMAQRLMGIREDATPVTVDEALSAANGYYADGCLPLWSAIQKVLGIRISGGPGWPEGRIRKHLQSGLAMAEVRLNNSQHFVLIHDTDLNAADPWDGRRIALYERYRPVGYRLLEKAW